MNYLEAHDSLNNPEPDKTSTRTHTDKEEELQVKMLTQNTKKKKHAKYSLSAFQTQNATVSGSVPLQQFKKQQTRHRKKGFTNPNPFTFSTDFNVAVRRARNDKCCEHCRVVASISHSVFNWRRRRKVAQKAARTKPHLHLAVHNVHSLERCMRQGSSRSQVRPSMVPSTYVIYEQMGK